MRSAQRLRRAVANAVPALAEEADLVTRAPNGAGVRSDRRPARA
jgi:hypothetical protein